VETLAPLPAKVVSQQVFDVRKFGTVTQPGVVGSDVVFHALHELFANGSRVGVTPVGKGFDFDTFLVRIKPDALTNAPLIPFQIQAVIVNAKLPVCKRLKQPLRFSLIANVLLTEHTPKIPKGVLGVEVLGATDRVMISPEIEIASKHAFSDDADTAVLDGVAKSAIGNTHTVEDADVVFQVDDTWNNAIFKFITAIAAYQRV
jgi:hypothetical protein